MTDLDVKRILAEVLKNYMSTSDIKRLIEEKVAQSEKRTIAKLQKK